MKILVTFALETEFSPWRTMHKFRESTWGKADVFATEISGADVAVLLTGVGQRPAKLALSRIAWGESGTSLETASPQDLLAVCGLSIPSRR